MVKKRDKSYEYPSSDSSYEEEKHSDKVRRPKKIRNNLQLNEWMR